MNQIINYIVFEVIPIILSGLVSLGVAYYIMKKTHECDKKLQNRVEERQRCDEICLLVCDFNAEANEAFKRAVEINYYKTAPGERISFQQRKELLKDKEQTLSSYIFRMKMIKDKIMVKTRGIKELDWISAELYLLLKVELFVNEPKDIYGNKLIWLSERVQSSSDKYIFRL